MQNLWNPAVERSFFEEGLRRFAPPQLFYRTTDKRYLAYWPKGYVGERATLQSRNSFIGKFTETWTRELIESWVKSRNLFAVQGVVCEDIGLTPQSPADVVIARKNEVRLVPEDIVVIFEVKMSIVWNWELREDKLVCLGDYKTHKGNPGLLRSDSMLKAIGKAINIRVSSPRAATIPVIVIGNTPIQPSYVEKVDHLKTSGIIQGFWSVNPKPLDEGDTLDATEAKGFVRFDTYESFQHALVKLLATEMNFFAGMKSKQELGRFIERANIESTYVQKAETFLTLLKDGSYE